MTLLSMKKGENATIRKLENGEEMKNRLMDLGFTPSSKTVLLYEAPSGDPKAFLIRGAVVALRKCDCEKIKIEEIK